jgi:hypothetical protein
MGPFGVRLTFSVSASTYIRFAGGATGSAEVGAVTVEMGAGAGESVLEHLPKSTAIGSSASTRQPVGLAFRAMNLSPIRGLAA